MFRLLKSFLTLPARQSGSEASKDLISMTQQRLNYATLIHLHKDLQYGDAPCQTNSRHACH